MFVNSCEPNGSEERDKDKQKSISTHPDTEKPEPEFCNK